LPRTTAGAAAEAVDDPLKADSSLPPAVVAARAVVNFNIERRDIPRGLRALFDIVDPSVLLLPGSQVCLRVSYAAPVLSRPLAPPLLSVA